MNEQLDEVERKTYRRHACAAVFDSSFTTLCWASADVAVKGFGAQELVVTLITMAPGAAQLLSLWLGRVMHRVGRRRLLRVAAILGRAPVLLVLFVSGPYEFLALLTLQAFSQVIITTSWNSLLHSNYRVARRGTLFAKASRYGVIAGGVVTVASGWWLDQDPEAFRILYPFAAICGVIACFVFAEIDVRRSDDGVEEEAPRAAMADLVRILFKDRNFLIYELGFFVYGLAFMSIMTAKPLRTAGELDFSYLTLLGSKGLLSVCMVVSTLAMGRLLDRAGPARLAQRCFALLAVYALALWFMTDPWTLFVAEAVFGVAMAGVHIAWNLGPITLAPRAALASSYMMVHIALVGVRAIIGHPLGGLLSEWFGPRVVFALGVVLWLLSSWIMGSLARRLALGHREVPAGP